MISLIIPVYNRPDEVDDLLASLTQQTNQQFEVVIVEDGSTVPCEEVCHKYASQLNISYYYKTNSGPGPSRNYGAAHATGDVFVVLDSDVIVPQDYIAHVTDGLNTTHADAFGGPDRAHDSFSTTQKAVSYAMTAFLTTGGIRGSKTARLDKFYPRSYNMGISREAYYALGGFAAMRYGEDIDFSIRLFAAGYRCVLFPDAWVWHKRRTSMRQFFRQVYHSGQARIALYKKHPTSLKVVHTLPAVFTIATAILILMAILFAFTNLLALLFLAPIVLYAIVLLVDATARNRSIAVGLVSVPAAFVQLIGYGTGFITAICHSVTEE